MATAFIGVLESNLKDRDVWLVIGVLPRPGAGAEVPTVLALSYLFASGAFGLIAMHLRSHRSRVATVAAAWAVSAGFVALAVASVLGYMGFHFIPTWIAVAVFVVLLTFGVAALITTRQVWMSWAALAALFGIALCIHSDLWGIYFYGSILSSAWFAALLVFAIYLNLSGRKETPERVP